MDMNTETNRNIKFAAEDKLFAFKTVASKYKELTDRKNELKLTLNEKEHQLANMKPATNADSQGKPRITSIEKEKRRKRLEEEIRDLTVRIKTIDSLLTWVMTQIGKLSPEIRYYCFSLNVLGKTISSLKEETEVRDNHRISLKINKSLEELITEDELKLLEDIINEDLDDEEFDLLTKKK